MFLLFPDGLEIAQRISWISRNTTKTWESVGPWNNALGHTAEDNTAACALEAEGQLELKISALISAQILHETGVSLCIQNSFICLKIKQILMIVSQVGVQQKCCECFISWQSVHYVAQFSWNICKLLTKYILRKRPGSFKKKKPQKQTNKTVQLHFYSVTHRISHAKVSCSFCSLLFIADS